MNLLVPLLILAIGPSAPIEGHYPDATEVYRCVFSQEGDLNYDGWPDGWTRRRGPGYPRYVSVRLSQEQTPVGEYCLRIDLDGAGAVAYSPPIPVQSLYEYVLGGHIHTQGLEHDRAWLSLTFLDADQQPVAHFASEKLANTEGWKKLSLGPVAPDDQRVHTVLIGLHLEPGVRADLNGTARFDGLWLGRLPRIALSTGHPLQMFTQPDVSVTCNASGFTHPDASVTFQLEDVHGTRLASEERRLQVSAAQVDESSTATISPQDEQELPALLGSAQWRPPIPGPGFYRICATMKGRQSAQHRPTLSLVVLEPQRQPDGSEFGWSIPDGELALPLPQLADLISQAGIGWVKYPLWYDEKTFPAKIEALIPFVEALGSQGIELVGLLVPPESLQSQASYRRRVSAAEIFILNPQVWYPTIEQTLARMAVQVRWWQLGNDRDLGFVGCPNLAGRIATVKAELDRLGNDVNVGFGWTWAQALPPQPDGEAPWRFLALSAQPPLTPEKLGEALMATQTESLRRWVVLEPLSRGAHPLDARVSDLVHQIMTAKIHGAEGIFVADPFSTERGLMNDDGTPGELFLPWRTAALALGTASDLGTIELPNRSANRFFLRQNEAVMIVWNDTPQREALFLGRNVRQLDPWGRPVRRETDALGAVDEVIEVGPVPTFVLGVDPSVVRWHQEVSFAESRLPSILTVRQDNALRMKNPLGHPVSGSLRLAVPDGWRVEPQDASFQLDSGQSLEQPLAIILADDAVCGPQEIRIDFTLHTSPPLRFSVYRRIEVGLGDVLIEADTALEESGELEVRQRIVNTGDPPINFRCYLYAPDRRRQATQIIGLGRGEERSTYRLADGRSLVGKTLWLRAEEIGGPRILNYRFVVKGEQ